VGSMKLSIYCSVLILLAASCNEGSDFFPLSIQPIPHNSENEFYVDVPVTFKDVNGPVSGFSGMEIFVNGNKIETEFLELTFVESGTYKLEVFANGRDRRYKLDTALTVVKAPPVFGDPVRWESVLFGWKTGTSSYKILLGTYSGNSDLDYEVLSIDKNLKQEGSLKKIDLGGYPEIKDHGVSSSGKLALLYDNNLEIYDNALNLVNRTNFSFNNIPHKIFIEGNNAVLMFDSLAHISLKKVDVNSGQILKGPTQFIGVEDMTVNKHFFLNESRAAIYYVSSNESKTLLKDVNVGGEPEFNQYFQPPFFINKVIPINSGYVITGIDQEKSILEMKVVDESNTVKWSRSFAKDNSIAIKELSGFIYAFYGNMRCIKFSPTGQMIWDKYFYSDIAHLNDVLITPNNEFIMIGTRQLTSNGQILQQDIIAIKIDAEGFRIR
jgi:hypothetical protein